MCYLLAYTPVHMQKKHGQVIEDLNNFDGTSRRKVPTRSISFSRRGRAVSS